jgi:hypothetical protein
VNGEDTIAQLQNFILHRLAKPTDGVAKTVLNRVKTALENLKTNNFELVGRGGLVRKGEALI